MHGLAEFVNETCIFPSRNEFTLWKKLIEESPISLFVQCSGVPTNKKGQVMDMFCARTQRRARSDGFDPCKCKAYMKVCDSKIAMKSYLDVRLGFLGFCSDCTKDFEEF